MGRTVKGDFILVDHGTISLLTAMNEEAKAYLFERVPEDAQTLGHSVAIEHRYVQPIVDDLAANGFTFA